MCISYVYIYIHNIYIYVLTFVCLAVVFWICILCICIVYINVYLFVGLFIDLLSCLIFFSSICRRFCDTNHRKRWQPFASIRDEVPMAVPTASSAKVVTLRGLKPRVASFHEPGMVLRGIPTCFRTCQKWFRVASAILLHRLQKMSYSFVASAALWRPPSSFCVAGAALQTCRVVWFLRIPLPGQRERNIDFEVANFEVHKKCEILRNSRTKCLF